MRLRVTAVIDGVTLPDMYFDHPNFVGSKMSATVFAEVAPAVITQYTQTGASGVPVSLGISATGTTAFSINDSHSPVNYTP
jgi:hypothetical protein